MSMANITDVVDFAGTTFHIVDYFVFALFLCISLSIGIYYSWRGQSDSSDYHLAGRQMSPVPVGISLGVSFMSAISLIGSPAEVYINGSSYALGCVIGSITYFMGCCVIGYLMHRLGFKSLSEYYTHRYNSKLVNIAVNVLVVIAIFHYMGGCMLGSILAFNGVTNGQITILTALLVGGLIGIFYTAIGGIKAVIWSDVAQFIFMFIGISVVIVKSAMETPGGFKAIIDINLQYERFRALDWTFDFTIRHTGWGMVIGYGTAWLGFSLQPACVQRLCCTKNVRDSIIVSAVGTSLFLLFSFLPMLAGFNIFANYTYRGCDVYAAGWINGNEIVLYYVRENMPWPGFQGLFIAALYAGSLSSFSSGLNAASAVLWNDIIQPLTRLKVSNRRSVHISKTLVVIFGLLAMAWCYALYAIGGLILQLMGSFHAVSVGTYLGTFLIAILLKYSTAGGVVTGIIIGSGIILWIAIGKSTSSFDNRVLLPSITHSCNPNITQQFNLTTNQHITVNASGPQTFVTALYSISYEWLSLFCLIVFLISSSLVILCTKQYKAGRGFTLFAIIKSSEEPQDISE